MVWNGMVWSPVAVDRRRQNVAEKNIRVELSYVGCIIKQLSLVL